MFINSRPTDQRAGVAPIAFVLQNQNRYSTPLTLKVRPEDLSMSQPHRTQVTQTLGKGTIGWADKFGLGLPTLTISGTTGWRAGQGSGKDGAEHWADLNALLTTTYTDAVQGAINSGLAPDTVKLLYVDMLNGLSWVVEPANVTLRRSKSRPLLFQYNISLQCVATLPDNPLMVLPFAGSIPGGLSALDRAISTFEGFGRNVEGWLKTAVELKDRVLAPVVTAVHAFVNNTARILRVVNGVISTGKNAINSTANSLIGLAADMSKVGINISRTIAAVAGIPQDIQQAIQRVSTAYSEVYCIFHNSLRARPAYQNYDGLFGASNCSSTTGGNQPSMYVNSNAFALMNQDESPVTITSSARDSISELGNADPVLAPKDAAEIARHTNNINNGITYK